MATVNIYGVSCTVNAVTSLVSSGLLNGPASIAFDPAGNLYTGQDSNNNIDILPAATAAVFGVSCTINTLQVLWSSGLSHPQGVCLDAAGNLYLINASSTFNAMVLPKASGTIFGHSVTANTLYTLASSLSNVGAIQIDSAGNLWILYGAASLGVLPVSSGTLFGVSVTAATFTQILASGPTSVQDLCVDPAGNVYITDYSGGTIWVLPKATGTIFGQSVTANTLHSLGTVTHAVGVCMDTAGNLYISSNVNSIKVISKTSTTLYGVSCTANTLQNLITTASAGHIELDPAGNLYTCGASSISVLASAAWPPVPSYTGAASQAVAFALSGSVPITSSFLSFFP